jgi:hypothetical protein
MGGLSGAGYESPIDGTAQSEGRLVTGLFQLLHQRPRTVI